MAQLRKRFFQLCLRQMPNVLPEVASRRKALVPEFQINSVSNGFLEMDRYCRNPSLAQSDGFCYGVGHSRIGSAQRACGVFWWRYGSRYPKQSRVGLIAHTDLKGKELWSC
jgi:hypothetical protein